MHPITFVPYEVPAHFTHIHPFPTTLTLTHTHLSMILDHTSLPLHILDNLRRQRPLLRHAQLGGESRMRDPSAGSPGRRLLHHLVDLFERQAFGLGHEEVSVDEADGAEGPPEEKHFGLQVRFVRVDEVGGYYRDDLCGNIHVRVVYVKAGSDDSRNSIANYWP